MKRIAAAAMVCGLLALGAPAFAHITFVSQYTFNQDVQPILRERCGTCHGEHGPGRSLIDFDRAKLNQVEIARSLMVGRMPPWSADAGAAALKGDQSLPPRELDILMTWAAGGAPRGLEPAPPAPPAVVAASTWARPDATLEMARAFVLDGPGPAVHEEVFAASIARGRAIRAVDVMPGDPSIVRRAEVAIRTHSGERTIGLWVPGDTPQALEAGAAYAVPRDASIVLRMFYMPPYGSGPGARSDRSKVGLFFSSGPRPPQPRELIIQGDGIFRVNETRVVSAGVDRPARALALRPISGPVDAIVVLDIIKSDGVRQPLARLQLRENWPRRYVFATPVSLGAGARIEGRVSRRDPIVWSSLTGDDGIVAGDKPLRIALDVID